MNQPDTYSHGSIPNHQAQRLTMVLWHDRDNLFGSDIVLDDMLLEHYS
jgi:hypothetical protein